MNPEETEEEKTEDVSPTLPESPVPHERTEGKEEEKEPSDSARKGKKKKKKSEPSSTKTTIISLAIALVFGTAGAFGGMFLYTSTHTIPTINTFDRHPSTPIQSKEAAIRLSLDSGTLVSDYKDKLYDLVNYSCWLQSQSPYAMNVGYSKATSSASTTKVYNATVSTPNEIFYQNISNTHAVVVNLNTAYRFYDDKSGTMKGYVLSTPSDWAKNPSPTDYTYDDYIQKYGKLFKANYFVAQSSDSTLAVPEVYLTDDLTTYEASDAKGKHEVNGVITYDLMESTVKSDESSIQRLDDGTYKVVLTLDPSTATSYYKVQMKTTGGLDDYPSFSKSHIEFHLDRDLYLIDSYFHDVYNGKEYGLSVNLDMVFYQYYYHSDRIDGFVDKDGNQLSLTIPSITTIDDPYTAQQIHDFSDVDQ